MGLRGRCCEVVILGTIGDLWHRYRNMFDSETWCSADQRALTTIADKATGSIAQKLSDQETRTS